MSFIENLYLKKQIQKLEEENKKLKSILNEGFFSDTFQKGKNFFGGRGFITDKKRNYDDLLSAVKNKDESISLETTKKLFNPNLADHIDIAIHASPHESVRSYAKKYFDPFNAHHVALGISSWDEDIRRSSLSSPLINSGDPLVMKALEIQKMIDEN
jgi:hypothetical protein